MIIIITGARTPENRDRGSRTRSHPQGWRGRLGACPCHNVIARRRLESVKLLGAACGGTSVSAARTLPQLHVVSGGGTTGSAAEDEARNVQCGLEEGVLRERPPKVQQHDRAAPHQGGRAGLPGARHLESAAGRGALVH